VATSLTLDRADAVTAFEDAYVERALRELGDRLDLAEAAVLDRRPLAGSGIALAGWWCPPNAGRELLVLPNPWDERSAIADHEAYCWELSELVIDRLADGLNEHHGVRRARGYWDLLLHSWLMYVLSASLDRRLYCLALSRLRPDIPVAKGPAMPLPATMGDAVETIRTDLGNCALGSHLAASLGLRLAPIEQQQPRGEDPELSPRSSIAAGALTILAMTLDQAVAAGAASRRGPTVAIAGRSGFSRLDRLRLGRRVPGLRLAPGTHDTSVPGGTEEDLETRGNLAALPGLDERGTAVAGAACLLLPRTIIEDYPALIERSVSAYGAPCAVVAGNYGPHDAENEFLGRCADAGRPLAFAQHGGTYLQARVNAQERLERRPGSVFLSWGGTGEGVRPLPSPHVDHLRDSCRGGDRVVLVEWIAPPDPYLLRFATTPLGNQGYRQSALLAQFVRSVQTVGDRLFLKRFPAFVEGVDRDHALAALPHRPPVLRRTAARLMAAARLAVISYPDTPFIEAMAIGVPTVGLWDPGLWELRDDARAPFEQLREAGVLFADPRAAAAHVDRTYDHAREWWASDDIQAARCAFLDRFAASGETLAQWSAYLRQLGDARA
jgi:putative transferase (TIGR04331 family)